MTRRKCWGCEKKWTCAANGLCARCYYASDQCKAATQRSRATQASARLAKEREEIDSLEAMMALESPTPREPLRTAVYDGIEYDVMFDGSIR